MAYQVDRFNGTFLVSVDDGTIDTTTDLRFVGKNYAGYGEVQNENFLHLLENFANTTAPPRPVSGQIWYDSSNKKIQFYDGTRFKIASGSSASTSAPAGSTAGDFWFDTLNEQLYTHNGTEFILIGPETPPESGVSGVTSQQIYDVGNVAHNCAVITSASETVAIVSKDAFSLKSDETLKYPGFTILKRGINLVNTGATGITATEHYFWGTSSNSLKLGNYTSDDFILKSDPTFSTAKFLDDGFYLGNNDDIRVYIDSTNNSLIEQQKGEPIKIRIDVSSSDKRDIGVFDVDSLYPGLSEEYTLGREDKKWLSVYANSLFGNLTGSVNGSVTGSVRGNVIANDSTVLVNASTKVITGSFVGELQGTVDGDCLGTADSALSLNGVTGDVLATINTIAIRDNTGSLTATTFYGTAEKSDLLKSGTAYRSTSVSAVGDTVVVRDGNADIFADFFRGTATAAQYADLAEKYLPDNEYEVGTVVSVGGDKEVTASKSGDLAIGVVSSNPAFRMNENLEGGVYIALKGRVPVKITGSVKKGDKLVATDDGRACVCVSAIDNYLIFAVALSDSDSDIVEAIIL